MKIKFLGITWHFGIVLFTIHMFLFMCSCGILMLWVPMFALAKEHEVNGIIAMGIASVIYFLLSLSLIQGISELAEKIDENENK